MFGFGCKKTAYMPTEGELNNAIEIGSLKWLNFLETVPFKDDVSLRDKIAVFAQPFSQGLKSNVPGFKDAPDSVVALILGNAIQTSGTHSISEIDAALKVSN